MYRQMAMTSSSMAYSWSKWNIEVNNPDQIVIQGAEQLEDEHLLEVRGRRSEVNRRQAARPVLSDALVNFHNSHVLADRHLGLFYVSYTHE